MRILVFGASGMLGSNACNAYRRLGDEVFGTARHPAATAHRLGLDAESIMEFSLSIDQSLSAQKERIMEILSEVEPEMVLNAIGAIKQKSFVPEQMLLLNTVFPWMLAGACADTGIRLVTVSTDCVFSGTTSEQFNLYDESSVPDATDLYGLSKLAGEPTTPGVLILRTSIIGLEPRGGKGLLRWFLDQDSCKGFTNAFWNGVTTFTLAKVARELNTRGEQGLIHVHSPQPVSKYELLLMFNRAFGLSTEVAEDSSVSIDRTMSSSLLDASLVPSLDQQLSEMASIYREESGFE